MNNSYGKDVCTSKLVNITTKDYNPDSDYKLIKDMEFKLQDVRDQELYSPFNLSTRDHDLLETKRTYGPSKQFRSLENQLFSDAHSENEPEPFQVPFWKMELKKSLSEALKFYIFGFSMALNASSTMIISFSC